MLYTKSFGSATPLPSLGSTARITAVVRARDRVENVVLSPLQVSDSEGIRVVALPVRLEEAYQLLHRVQFCIDSL